MGLRIENNYINTSYYKQNKKVVVPKTSFEKAFYYKKFDVSYNADQNIKNMDDIILNSIY